MGININVQEDIDYGTASSDKTEFDILSESPPSGRHVEFWGFFIVSGSERTISVVTVIRTGAMLV